MRNKINILYVIGSLRVSGAEKALVTIVRGINKERFHPIVCCTGGGGELESTIRKCGIPVKIFGSGRFYDFVEIIKLSQFIKRENVDIVHTQLFESDIIGRIAAKLAKVPIIISTFQNIYQWKQSKKLKERIKTIVDRITSNYYTDQLIAVSHSVKNFHIEKCGIRADKIVTLPNLVDFEKLKLRDGFDPVKKRQELSLKPGVPIMINIGRLFPQKGQKYLIQAAAKVASTFKKVKFLIVGNGFLLSDLKREVESLQLSDNVKFLGKRDDIPELLSISDVFVLSSLWEGLSVALLEAMAMGKPIVATNVDGALDVIKHKKEGLLVPPKDSNALTKAIIYLLENKEKAKKMGTAAKKKVVEQFSTNVVVRKLEQLYEKLLTEKLSSGVNNVFRKS